ncbi:PREDICTED: uncharacterized protein LOC107192106 [Dufourea novaeangliae]|uniref:uncharacterized protein LOC107192106 n=1 Tax=Dufourea novaeangliae TaxID=178035 RepID=UPI0007678C70|nr:PREDICTED: uncharacterized protein LOC107192106 [Dufourea novaeangliae]
MTESTDDTSDFVQAMIADRKDIMIDGRRLTISAMDKSIRMLFLDYPILDTSLSYIPIYTHLELKPLKTIQTPILPPLLQKQKELT